MNPDPRVAASEPVRCRVLVEGAATGTVLVLDEPLSFWGGFDAETGVIVDLRHPQAGAKLTGKVVAMQSGRGSSSSGSVLAEAIRAGTAPAAILLGEVDEIMVVGALVAAELYGAEMPILLVPPAAMRAIHAADRLSILRDGTITRV